MDKDKLKGYINICHKAGYLIIGGEKLKNYNKKLYLILYDNQVQKNSKKILEKLKENGLNLIEVENLELLTSIKNCKIIGIKNKSISDIVINMLKK